MDSILENRLRRLEWSNRVLTSILLIIVVFFVIGAFQLDSAKSLIRAQRIELVNADGQLQSVLGIDQQGSNGLMIYDAKGVVRISLTHDEKQSALFINDAVGTTRVGVAQFSHGGGGFALHGEGSKGATVLYHKKTGSLSFYDDTGKSKLRIPAE